MRLSLGSARCSVAVGALGLAACREEPSPRPATEVEASSSAQAESARDEARARIATWNIRWFPDGAASPGTSHATDRALLAQSMADLHAPVIAVQEFVLDGRGQHAERELRAELDRLTGGTWQAFYDPCAREGGRQHTGLLVDTRRVAVLAEASAPRLSGNAQGDGCAGHMRPGVAVALRFPGGLDAWVVSVHLDSGRDDRAFVRRGEALGSLASLRAELASAFDEADVVVVGDFNTMGSDRGLSALEEIRGFERLADAAGFRRLWLSAPCTEISGARATMLDHVLVTRTVAELPDRATATVRGPCARDRCRVDSSDPWLVRLSDHCPVVVELRDVDLDP